MSFQQKYLKYKKKYLNLKRDRALQSQLGGSKLSSELSELTATPKSEVQKGGASLFPEDGFVDMNEHHPVEADNTTTELDGTVTTETNDSGVEGAVEDLNSEPASVDTDLTIDTAIQNGGGLEEFSELRSVFGQTGGMFDDSDSDSDSDSISSLSSVSSDEFDL